MKQPLDEYNIHLTQENRELDVSSKSTFVFMSVSMKENATIKLSLFAIRLLIPIDFENSLVSEMSGSVGQKIGG